MSLEDKSSLNPSQTPVPRLRTNITSPSTPTPVPRARTKVSLTSTQTPVPRSKSYTPVPTPRTTVKASPSDPTVLVDCLKTPEYSKPVFIEESPTDMINLDEDTVLLPVINMEDIDPEFHPIINDFDFSSPGKPIILPGKGTSTPNTKDAGKMRFPPASDLPPTPPETPEVPYMSSEVEISTNSLNEETLAESLDASNLNDSLQENEVFVTPQKKTFRKKQRQPSKQDKSKEAHNKGQEYISTRGKLVNAREMKPACENCRFKCNEKVSENQRATLFKNFWELGDKERRDGFIRECITVKEPEVHKNGDDVTQRTHTIKYSFKFPVIGQVFVCKTMFLNTLAISEGPVRTQVAKLERGVTVPSPDKRGRHPKINPAVKEKQDGNIMEHISLFQTVPSHFCRLRSKRKYLSAHLTIRHMWHLYKTWMSKNKPGEDIKSEKYYRKFFCTKFNLGFYKPKKDRCDLCLIYEIGTTAQKKKLQVKYDEHIRNKKSAKEARKRDEQHAKSCRDNVCYCLMDLQQVVSLPKTEAGMVFNKRKLSTYNFTVYDRILKNGYCYLWDESEAKRGANEIATCVLLFIKKKVSEGITDFFIWSDNCSGQNKNKYLFAAYTWAAAQYNITINHRYMERGHTMNEADSMHATIERAARYEQIFEPKDLVPIIILNAKRSGSKYDVHLVGPEILDLHPLADNLQNWASKNAKWKSVREINVDWENSPGKVFVKHDFTAAHSIEVKITKVGRQVNLATYSIPKAYNGPLVLKAKKLADLATLCRELIIPSHKHAFYEGLINFPALQNPLIDSGNEEGLSEDEEARQIAERDFLLDYENDEEKAVESESDYDEEVIIAKRNRFQSKRNEDQDADGQNSEADAPDFVVSNDNSSEDSDL
ncbi:LysM and putative peptidoglycan-binding domain-containing protein 2 [Frankliniella fusca]|uniref:LysM and putative peptidoglycan-binding domain-containing protein 2 n=1 Tax=Frankliniella fusca TaxID=407009 RepID=A0AAE1GYZ0_9NEOP|nr:LysM and putative peptidoglycan-binding domain-containing protein 2 [Frankliniella fusca]